MRFNPSLVTITIFGKIPWSTKILLKVHYQKSFPFKIDYFRGIYLVFHNLEDLLELRLFEQAQHFAYYVNNRELTVHSAHWPFKPLLPALVIIRWFFDFIWYISSFYSNFSWGIRICACFFDSINTFGLICILSLLISKVSAVFPHCFALTFFICLERTRNMRVCAKLYI